MRWNLSAKLPSSRTSGKLLSTGGCVWGPITVVDSVSTNSVPWYLVDTPSTLTRPRPRKPDITLVDHRGYIRGFAPSLEGPIRSSTSFGVQLIPHSPPLVDIKYQVTLSALAGNSWRLLLNLPSHPITDFIWLWYRRRQHSWHISGHLSRFKRNETCWITSTCHPIALGGYLDCNWRSTLFITSSSLTLTLSNFSRTSPWTLSAALGSETTHLLLMKTGPISFLTAHRIRPAFDWLTQFL